MVRTQSQGLESESTLMYQRASSSPASSLLLELRIQHAEYRGRPGTAPSHMYRGEGIRVIVQNHVVAPDPSWGSWLGSAKRSPSGEPRGAPFWPRSQAPAREPILRELLRDNNTASSQGCRKGAQASCRLGGQGTQARACGGYKSPGSNGLGGHEAASQAWATVAPCLIGGLP